MSENIKSGPFFWQVRILVFSTLNTGVSWKRILEGPSIALNTNFPVFTRVINSPPICPATWPPLFDQ